MYNVNKCMKEFIGIKCVSLKALISRIIYKIGMYIVYISSQWIT